jgi:hypothetical protein
MRPKLSSMAAKSRATWSGSALSACTPGRVPQPAHVVCDGFGRLLVGEIAERDIVAACSRQPGRGGAHAAAAAGDEDQRGLGRTWSFSER